MAVAVPAMTVMMMILGIGGHHGAYQGKSGEKK
jgi:hypothetical protein